MPRRPLFEEPMVNISVRVTPEQEERVRRTNDSSERIRRFIDSWDMVESPEQLEIEALEHERTAREEIVQAKEKRDRAKILRSDKSDDWEDIRENYEHYNVGDWGRDRQLKWLEDKWGLTPQKAREFLAHYGPGRGD